MVVPFLGTLVYFVILPGGAVSQVVYGATKLFTLVFPLAVYFLLERRWQGTSVEQSGGWDWGRQVRSLPVGLLTGLLMGGAMVGLFELSSLGDYVRGYSETVRGKAAGLGVLEHYWLFGVFISVGHSLLEEYYWRWYVFGRLSGLMRPAGAYFLGSLAFAGHHYVVLGSFFSWPGALIFGTCVGIGGGLWCWLFRRWGTLAGNWVSHLLVDAAIFYVR